MILFFPLLPSKLLESHILEWPYFGTAVGMTSTRVDFLDGALLGSPWLTFSVNNNRLPWHWPPVSVSPLRLCEMREGLVLWEGAACRGEGRGAGTRWGWGRGGVKASAWPLGISLPGGEGLLFQLCGWSSGGCRPGGLEVGGAARAVPGRCGGPIGHAPLPPSPPPPWPLQDSRK